MSETTTRLISRAPRLNPFAFPSDTDLRFVLLVVAIVGVSLFMYDGLSMHLAPVYQQTAQQCLAAEQGVASDDPAAQAEALMQCLAPADHHTGLWLIGGVAIVLGVAALIYWLMPIWKIRRDRLEPFIADDDPELIAYVAALAHEAGLPRAPTILTNADMTPSGLAFGRWGRYFLVLNAGLILQFAFDQPSFRAVVLHELAHLRNGDVDKTYFSLAAGASIVVAAIVPYLVVLARSETAGADLADLLNEGLRLIAALVLILLPIAGILRARELYADVRASSWDGAEGALHHLLEELEPTATGLRSAVSVHPSPALRVRSVEDPRMLLGMSFWDALAIGIAATVAYPDLTLMLGLLTSGQGDLHLTSAVVSGLIFGALAAAIVGTGVWRAAFAGLSDDRPRVNLTSLALGLALGITIGLPLSITGYLRGAGKSLDVSALVFALAWWLVLFVSLRALLAWVSAGARTWLAAALPHASPRAAYLGGLAVTALLLGLWLSLLLLARDFLGGNGDMLQDSAIVLSVALGFGLIILPHPLAFAALVGLWAFPLASVWWQKAGRDPTSERPSAEPPTEAASRWYWLDPSARTLQPSEPAQLHIRRALILGSVGGLVFCALLAAVRLGMRLALDADTYESDDLYMPLLLGQVAAAVLAQLIIAVIGARRTEQLAVVQGLLTLSVAGCIMMAGIVATHVALGPELNPRVVPDGLGLIVNLSAVLAAPMIWLTRKRQSPVDRRQWPLAPDRQEIAQRLDEPARA